MKNLIKVLLIIIALVIGLALIFLGVDLSRAKNDEKPIFCILKTEVNDGGTKIYLGLGYKVIDFHTLNGFDRVKVGTWLMNYDDFKHEIEENTNKQPEDNSKYVALEDVKLDYNLANMVEDKCCILMNSDIVYHIEELDNFIKNVENNIADEIRIVQYTIEGQPILTDLEYENNKFILKIDNRRDGYAAEEDKRINKKEYNAIKYKLVREDITNDITDSKSYYSLNLKALENEETINICDYAIIKEKANEKFQLKFNKNLEDEEIMEILTKTESDKYDFNIYSYKGTVDVIIDGEKMPLKDALINNKITIDEILEKAYKDANEKKIIYGDVYRDGGSKFYLYNDYSILKLNIEGFDEEEIVKVINKDLYIGVPSMNINDIKNLS